FWFEPIGPGSSRDNNAPQRGWFGGRSATGSARWLFRPTPRVEYCWSRIRRDQSTPAPTAKRVRRHADGPRIAPAPGQRFSGRKREILTSPEEVGHLFGQKPPRKRPKKHTI